MARVKRHPVQTAANYPLFVPRFLGMAFLTRRPQVSQVKRSAPVTDRYPVVNLGCWPLSTQWQAILAQGLLGQLQTAQPLPPSRLVDIGVFSHCLVPFPWTSDVHAKKPCGCKVKWFFVDIMDMAFRISTIVRARTRACVRVMSGNRSHVHDVQMSKE